MIRTLCAVLSLGALGQDADGHAEKDCRCWAAQGQCTTNPDFMSSSCPASCAREKLCEDASAAQQIAASEAKLPDQVLSGDQEELTVKLELARKSKELAELVEARAAEAIELKSCQNEVSGLTIKATRASLAELEAGLAQEAKTAAEKEAKLLREALAASEARQRELENKLASAENAASDRRLDDVLASCRGFSESLEKLIAATADSSASLEMQVQLAAEKAVAEAIAGSEAKQDADRMAFASSDAFDTARDAEKQALKFDDISNEFRVVLSALAEKMSFEEGLVWLGGLQWQLHLERLLGPASPYAQAAAASVFAAGYPGSLAILVALSIFILAMFSICALRTISCMARCFCRRKIKAPPAMPENGLACTPPSAQHFFIGGDDGDDKREAAPKQDFLAPSKDGTSKLETRIDRLEELLVAKLNALSSASADGQNGKLASPPGKVSSKYPWPNPELAHSGAMPGLAPVTPQRQVPGKALSVPLASPDAAPTRSPSPPRALQAGSVPLPTGPSVPPIPGPTVSARALRAFGEGEVQRPAGLPEPGAVKAPRASPFASSTESELI